MDIGRKTTAELIDELITATIRCWVDQDKIMTPGANDETVAKYSKSAQVTNIKRKKLMGEINRRLGESEMDKKSYDHSS